MEIVISLETLFSENMGPLLLKAFVVGLLTAICAAMLGVPLVLKRYSMIGDGLSHMGFCALAIAAAFGVSDDKQMLITMPLVVISAVVLLLLSESGKIKGDAAIAMLSTGAVAAGYVIYSVANKGAGDVCSSLFGTSILALKSTDVTLSVILAVGVILVFVLLFTKIFAVTFDNDFAKSAGTNASLYNVLLAVLTAVTIVVGMKMIGSIMISALIVFPALSAMRICKRFKSVIVVSALISAFNFTLGLVFSASIQFHFGHQVSALPIGPCVVCFNVFTLLLCIGVKAIADRVKGKKAVTKGENA